MMDKPSPVMRRALRQAELYGCLLAQTDRLYHPGGKGPVCTVSTAREMVRSGWLIERDGRYEITPDGRQAVEAGQIES
jgi:hypothetical protein